MPVIMEKFTLYSVEVEKNFILIRIDWVLHLQNTQCLLDHWLPPVCTITTALLAEYFLIWQIWRKCKSLYEYTRSTAVWYIFSSHFIKILLLWILWNHNVRKITFGSLPLSTKSLLNVVRLYKYIWIKFTASVLLGFETHFKITFFLLWICSKSMKWLQNDRTIGHWVYLGTKSIGRI